MTGRVWNLTTGLFPAAPCGLIIHISRNTETETKVARHDIVSMATRIRLFPVSAQSDQLRPVLRLHTEELPLKREIMGFERQICAV